MLFSNFFANTPTNLEQFGSLITQFTNSLYSLDFERPKFSISLNGTMLSDRSIVFLQKSREIFLQATNIGGGETADRLTIDFFADLAGTNLVANGWTLEPKSNIGWNQWQMTAQSLVAIGSCFNFTTFSISTNFHAPFLISQISVYSSRSKLQIYHVGFVLIQ